jgi:hypothetical protein
VKTKLTNPHGALPEEIEAKFEQFVEGVKAKVAEHYETQYPTLTPDKIDVITRGSVYWKLVKNRDNGQCSVYGFVRKADGAIFKAANWKAPFTKGPTAIRGYVTDEFPLDATTPYGIVYAR